MRAQNISQSEIDAFLARGKSITRLPTVGDGIFPSESVDPNELFRFSSIPHSQRLYRRKKNR